MMLYFAIEVKSVMLAYVKVAQTLVNRKRRVMKSMISAKLRDV